MVWATGAALSLVLLLVAILLTVVVVNGMGVFWPARVAEITLANGSHVLGERVASQVNPDTGVTSLQFKTGNRDLDPQRQDFHWYDQAAIRRLDYPARVVVLERLQNGNLYGYLDRLTTPGVVLPAGGSLEERFAQALAEVRRKSAEELDPVARQLYALSRQIADIRDATFRLDYRRKQLGATSPDAARRARGDARREQLEAESREVNRQSEQLVAEQRQREAALRANVAVLTTAAGQTQRVPLLEVVRWYCPNAMGPAAKVGHYLAKIWELLSANPRESNTEGGLFPAIFGTVMLVFLMALTCFPLGVMAGVYLGEYAREGFLVRLVRIAVNNLAGIPSIVYGIFGLGFFVYGIGGLIDQWLYPERAAVNMPTFGTGGILWASLTLGLLTIPVVIVSTEEALRVIPRGIRESSLALGATKFQTLRRVLLPLASPGIMTGFILAMSRAAGEVAPLMITGVVKLAPELPLDGQFPFFHPDRKFMHLGFHIFDIGFQSPNVEASKPMVYVTTLLLLLIVVAMTGLAIYLRNRMRKRYQLRTM
jgi:phosphate transport system permease protein